MLSRSSRSFLSARMQPKFVPGPPRHLNEARIPTVDRKTFSLMWNGRNQIDITLEDRVSRYTFPMLLGRDGAKFVSCFRDGGMVTLTSASEDSPPLELRVGSDKGLLYFSMKGDSGTITTGLGPGEAALANSLVCFADRQRIMRSFR
jgi:hypothetical protein